MLAALALLKSRWTWYALLALALVAGAVGLRAHYIYVGVEQGKEQQAAASQQDIELQHQAAQADAREKIAQADARAAAAQADAAASDLRTSQLRGQLSAARAAVAALPDSALHGHITAALGRPAADQTPGYTAGEEREIARRVDAEPLLEQAVTEQGRQIDALGRQVTALASAAVARDAYTSRLEGWYTQLYNLHPPKKRAAKCLWLWSCGVNRLPVPAPSELK